MRADKSNNNSDTNTLIRVQVTAKGDCPGAAMNWIVLPLVLALQIASVPALADCTDAAGDGTWQCSGDLSPG